MSRKKVQPINPDVIDEFATEDLSSRVVVYKEVIGYDADGQVMYDVVQRPRHQNGSGFVISYTSKINEFLRKVSTGSIIRVFLYIAHNQSYGQNGQFGMRCSHRHLEEALRIDRTTIWDALKYLKEKGLINESRIDGCSEFMVNPEYVTIGADKNIRTREWIRRRSGDVIGAVAPVIARRPEPTLRRSVPRVVVECDMN